MPDTDIDEKKVMHLILEIGLTVIVLAAVVSGLVSPAIGHRLHDDFWPLDRSAVSPNILASLVQAVLVTIILSALYPPIRKSIERWVTRHKDDIKAHISEEHLRTHRLLTEAHSTLHSKLDTIIESNESDTRTAGGDVLGTRHEN